MKVVDDMIKKLEELNNKEYSFDIKTKICVYIMIFLAGAIAGFIYEEIFTLLFDHELVKRGFLYGPYLPVYGFGAVFLTFFLKRFKKNPLVIFLLAMVITGVLEYITGYLMWEIYHRTWWDYTGLFLNINGYVCLRSVLTFAIGAILLIYVIEPVINYFVGKTKNSHLVFSSLVVVSIFLLDLMFTILFRNTI